MIDARAPLPLRNPVKHYAWGARGAAALIPELLGIPAGSDVAYAELWIGAHASGPSEVEGAHGITLDAVIAADPLAVLGERCVRTLGPRLPYMLKVLCVSRPLSVQVHPGRALAAKLHRAARATYPDPYVKSEVAVALDSFTALVGFQNSAGIDRVMRLHPALAEVVDEETRRARPFTRSGTAPPAVAVRRTIAALGRRMQDDPGWVERLTHDVAETLAASSHCLRPEEELFLRLRADTDGADVGLLLVLLMNVVSLAEGQAVEVGPGMPHAYLTGNAVECMSSSDNVVRAGLTSKVTDVDMFARAVRFRPRRARVFQASGASRTCYETASTEFRLCRHVLETGDAHQLGASGPRLLVVMAGSVRLGWGAGPSSGALGVGRGGAVLLPDAVGRAHVQAETRTVLFTASVP